MADTPHYYRGIKVLYFGALLRTLIRIGNLNHHQVLDFGCGTQELRKVLAHGNYVGYDINPQCSDVRSLDGITFDVMVANEVFYEMSEQDIVNTLETLRPPTLVVGISRQGILNKVGAALLHPAAHTKTITPPKKELEILTRSYRIVARKNVWFLADVYLLQRIER